MSPSPPEENTKVETRDTLTVSRVARADDQRRIRETTALACVALAGVWWLRFPTESRLWCTAEILCVLLLGLLLAWSTKHRRVYALGLLLTPVVFAVAARRTGFPIPYEMTAIAFLGVGSFALALSSRNRRLLALSVVTSGFLVLFTTLISDSRSALVPALVWITVCLWHLVANHWERVTACLPEEVRRTTRVKPATVIVGLLVFVLGAWGFHGRATQPQRFSFGMMPTSGGTSWSDPAARSGVGSGDAAIAAKDQAESFGAVESELFLESTQSTLFDMFSDSIGQPRLKQVWERRQGMTPDKLIHAHQQTTKSERGSASFSTSRDKPPPPPQLSNARERAVLQWIGPTGIRLAMNRYDQFDGVGWSLQASWKDDQLSRVLIDEEPWFFDPRQTMQRVIQPEQFHQAGILKVLRLRATHIPAPMMTAGVHIKDIDRPDFFAIDHDGSLFMPGRKKIPALTVLHLAATSVMEDELLGPDSLAKLDAHVRMLALVSRADAGGQPQESPSLESVESAGQVMARELAQELTAGETNAYRKLQKIVTHLRSEYTFDRQSASAGPDPLHRFLTGKRGGDHLFATAAAVMGRSLGLHTRLASGFYVRPSAFDVGQGHTSILPEDVHVWVEVQLDDGRWIELEPTPGYRQPVYEPSNWLLVKRFAADSWPLALGVATISTFAYLTRVIWFELLVALMWWIVRRLPDRQRVRVLLWILQQRGRIAGRPRRTGVPQRDWILALTEGDAELRAGAIVCCDAADGMIFGGKSVGDWTASANLLVRHLTTRYISRGESTAPSQLGATL